MEALKIVKTWDGVAAGFTDLEDLEDGASEFLFGTTFCLANPLLSFESQIRCCFFLGISENPKPGLESSVMGLYIALHIPSQSSLL